MVSFNLTRNLAGQTIVITGASSGIGKEVALLCAQAGARTILLGRNVERLEEVAHMCGENSEFIVADFAKKADVDSVLARLEQETDIEALINCAGYGLMRPFLELSEVEIQAMFQVNFFATLALTHTVIRKMLQQNKGHIITIASQDAKLPTPEAASYSASKSAILSYMNVLRLELYKTDIHITTVNPGPVATAFFERADESGAYLQPIKPFLVQPIAVARKIVKAIGTSKREINLPFSLQLADAVYHLFPHLGDYIVVKLFKG